MITPKAIERAQRLLGDQRRIAAVQWNGVVDHPGFRPAKNVFSRMDERTSHPDQADEQLQWAIEEYRKRKLDALNAELRELGVDPDAVEEEAAADA